MKYDNHFQGAMLNACLCRDALGGNVGIITTIMKFEYYFEGNFMQDLFEASRKIFVGKK